MEENKLIVNKPLQLRDVFTVLAIYVVVCVTGTYFHELWFDEVEHFILARDTQSLSALFAKSNYDDHVGLWKVILYYLTHYISDNPFSLQVLHLITASFVAFVFLRYAPFYLLTKILILSGYYFVFEFSFLCRNYAIGLLFLFIICRLLSEPRKNLILIGGLLLLLSNTHEFFAFCSVGIYAYLLCYSYGSKQIDKRFIAFTLLFVAAIATVGLQALNIPKDQNNAQALHSSWLTIHNVSFAVHGIDKGFIPFPTLHDPNFWNRHLFESWPSYIKVPTSLFFLSFPLWALRNSRKALLYFIICETFLLLFLTMSQMTAARYFGMFFIYFITALWLASYDGTNMFLTKGDNKSRVELVMTNVFYLILFTQVLAGAYAYQQDLMRPFSQAKYTIDLITTKRLDGLPIVVDGYTSGPALSAYFRHPLYYLDIDDFGSYYAPKPGYDARNRKPLKQTIAESKYLKNKDQFILITNRSASDSELLRVPGFSFNKMGDLKDAIIVNENYSVYKATAR